MPLEIKNIRNASKIASTKDINLVRKSSNITSRMLLSVGVNLNYAPVLDIRRFTDDNHAIGNRCFGENKEDVSKYGIEYMKEMSVQNVVPVIKHFPGHGATLKDSHFTLPIVKKSKIDLEQDDMVPFKNAIEAGADAIMVSHILIKDIDRKYPASLSKKLIEEYLIKKFNYKGLIITDDLKMLAIRLRYPINTAVKLAINAGNDMIMIGYKYKKIEDVIEGIAKQVRKGKISEKQIEESVKKIIQLKKKYNINDDPVKGLDIESINKEIDDLNDMIQNKSERIQK